MALEIIPLGNIVENGELTRIALTINSLVNKEQTRQFLQSRHLLGVIARHEGRVSNSEQAVSSARRLHTSGKLGVYVLKQEARYVGMATVDPSPVLRKQIIAVPPKFAFGPLSRAIELPGPEVSAWVAPGHGPAGLNNLTQAYRELSVPNGIAKKQFEQFADTQPDANDEGMSAWTIEPYDAPQWVHTAIRRSGFDTDARHAGLHDDGESKKYAPPMSRLYIAPTQ